MKSKNLPPLDEMSEGAAACEMSMELMGVRREDLIDDIEVGTLAS